MPHASDRAKTKRRFRDRREGGLKPVYSCKAPAIRRDRRASRFATISNRIDSPIIKVAAAVIAGLSCSRRPVQHFERQGALRGIGEKLHYDDFVKGRHEGKCRAG